MKSFNQTAYYLTDPGAYHYHRGLVIGRDMSANLVEAGECICLYLSDLDGREPLGREQDNLYYLVLRRLTDSISVDYSTRPPTVTKHAPCCCKYLAEKIRSGGQA